MIRTAAVLMVLLTACTVPSIEELDGCEWNRGLADAVLGEGNACKAVQLSITYEGFRPGCVRVLARDEGSGQEISTELPDKGDPTNGTLVVVVLPSRGWGSSMLLEADAFERTCEGQPVVSSSALVAPTRGQTTPVLQLLATDQDQDGYVSIRTGGTDCNDDSATIHPGVTALRCNEVSDTDDNCNGQADRVELRLGLACTEGLDCEGTRRCGENGAAICSVPNALQVYPDLDRDGHGDAKVNATASCKGVPAGFVTGPNDDCDDEKSTVYAGAQERCDTLDNDCNGAADETYAGLGTDCADETSQCGGKLQCNGAGTALACVVSQPTSTWYPDDDGDGHGRNSGAVQRCVQPTGFVSQGGDCDDGNPFTHPGARELCDAADNNCDSAPEGVCSGGEPVWASRTVGSASTNWRAVVTLASGMVWVVGNPDVRARLLPGGNTFQTTTTGCIDGSGFSTSWDSLWVDEANNGRGYFGSEGGRLVFQDINSPNCSDQHDLDRHVRGLVGFGSGANLEIHGVTFTGTASGGSTFIWNGAGTHTYGTTSVAPLYDVHGISRATLFAVGGTTAPRIYRFNATSGQWQQETLPADAGMSRLNGVWVVNEKLAFAVGDQSTVLKWDGTAWSKLSFPNNIESLRSVVAFGASSAYAAAFNGRVYRYDGQSWQEVYENTSDRYSDIAGTSPEDLWVVGNSGVILHWPQWPQ